MTKKKYQSRKVTLEKLFGDKPISQIRPSEYQRIMNSYGQRVSRNFLSRLNTGVKQSLQVAIADKVMIEDFTQNVELFSTVKSGTIIMMEYRNFMQIIMLRRISIKIRISLLVRNKKKALSLNFYYNRMR
ncbi:hypothetical protein SAG0135_02515 [Streptococcus agalactiae LMG 14609]|nr:hypothetical protein SAG0135_02515 [Streptococcus agalactiae LMG 14609]